MSAAPLNPESPVPTPRLWAERFDLIDSWRGLAALAVVIHHVAHVHIGGPAVMVFFVISGYCIAASADSCRRRNLGFRQFMWRRVRRIYPPYLLSLAFWAATRAVKTLQTGVNDLDRPWWQWIQNITLTQWLTPLFDPNHAAPANETLFVSAYWSLCYEEQFYLIVGLMLVAAATVGVSVRLAIAAMIAVGLVWNCVFPQLATGLFIEYWALFGIGALVFYRLCRIHEVRWRRAIDAFLVALAIGSAYLRWFAGIEWRLGPADMPTAGVVWGEYRIVWAELFVGAVFALSLIAMRPLNDLYRRSWISLPLGALGAITFSLYLIHQFNLAFISSLVGLADRFVPGTFPAWLRLVLELCGHIALASVFWFFCERPFLNKSLLGTPPATPAEAAKPQTSPSGLASPAGVPSV